MRFLIIKLKRRRSTYAPFNNDITVPEGAPSNMDELSTQGTTDGNVFGRLSTILAMRRNAK